ncbi:MAM and LDL-receptor class A domain-containing protein 1-like [Ciona intestinalis]
MRTPPQERTETGDRSSAEMLPVAMLEQMTMFPYLVEIEFHSDLITSAPGFVLHWDARTEEQLPASSFNCSFDRQPQLCPGWTQDQLEDNHDWSFTRGETPSSRTGPPYDHTIGTLAGGYAFFEASNENGVRKLSGDTAMLLTPFMDISGVEHCFEFWVHNKGAATLHVIYALEGSENSSFTDQTIGETNEEWKRFQFNITDDSFQVAFTAVRGPSFRGDVAIDDVKLYPGNCVTGVTSSTTSCTDLQFTCSDGQCIVKGVVCDGTDDCIGGEDEQNCETCQPTFVYDLCASACNHTCADGPTAPPCTQTCRPGCECPDNTPVVHEGRCITYQECPVTTPSPTTEAATTQSTTPEPQHHNQQHQNQQGHIL